MNYVLDTHVWISIFGSHRFEKFLKIIIANNISIFTCPEQEKEFADVHHKYSKIKKLLPLKTKIYAEAMELSTNQLLIGMKYRLLSDYKDNYLIDLANSSAAILVSNDKGFSPLKKLLAPTLKIISIEEFYKILKL